MFEGKISPLVKERMLHFDRMQAKRDKKRAKNGPKGRQFVVQKSVRKKE